MSSSMTAQVARRMGIAREIEESLDRAVTTRPASTAVFGIDSDDRYTDYNQRRVNPSYPFSFNVTKNESLLNGFFTRLAVTEFRLNWTLPNISSAWGNDQINIAWLAGGVPPPAGATITMPTAFYTVQSFCEVFQALVRAIPGNPLPSFTATRAADGTIVMESNTATTIQFGPLVTSVALAKQRQLFDMLSLPPPTAFAATVLSGIPNMRATDYIDIVSPQITYNQDLKDAASAPIVRDMLVRIYLDESCKPIAEPTYVTDEAPPVTSFPSFTNGDDVNGVLPFVIYRQFANPKQVQWNNAQPLGNVTFELYDDQGRSIQDLWTRQFAPTSATGYRFANSFTWNITLLVTEN
jgi:hypothetical protein